MPIVDYEAKARQESQRVFADPQISEKNKVILDRFLGIYEAEAARRSIFLRLVRLVLRQCDDFERTMHDRDSINQIFRGLREKYRPATYASILACTLRLARWLNDGERPVGLRDLKRPPSRKMRRYLRPEDMVTWDDGELLARSTTDVQVAAALLVQLDGGFRPSEFIDLCFGDIRIQEKLAIALVRKGKTGSRHVVMHRCVEPLARWVRAHPTRQPEDPLWVDETATRFVRDSSGDLAGVHCARISYDVLRCRIRRLGRLAGMRKPLDFYNLRHSSCALDKRSNLPVDLASEKHGHSVKYFTEVYGRLSVEDTAERFIRHFGLGENPDPRSKTDSGAKRSPE